MQTQTGAIPRKDFLRAAAAIVGVAISQTGWNPSQALAQSQAQGAADRFAARILSDTATTMLSLGAYIGDRLGIYQAMADAGPSTVSELAVKTRLNEHSG
jgi:hypothetical protein